MKGGETQHIFNDIVHKQIKGHICEKNPQREFCEYIIFGWISHQDKDNRHASSWDVPWDKVPD